MTTYQRVAGGGNIAGKNVFKITITGGDPADIPVLKAFADTDATSVAIQCLQGTPNNGRKSLVAAASTDAAPTGSNWVPTNATAGAALINRLRGDESYVKLGTSIPNNGDSRLFNMTMGCAPDTALGTAGNRPIFFIEIPYVGAAVTFDLYANIGTDNLGDGTGATWQELTMFAKGATLPPTTTNNAIFASGNSGSSPATSLAKLSRSSVGEVYAQQLWIRTAL